MRKNKMANFIFRVFPKTMAKIQREFKAQNRQAWQNGYTAGVESERTAVYTRLKQHDLKDMGKSTLTLGYHTAMRAALNEIDV